MLVSVCVLLVWVVRRMNCALAGFNKKRARAARKALAHPTLRHACAVLRKPTTQTKRASSLLILSLPLILTYFSEALSRKRAAELANERTSERKNEPASERTSERTRERTKRASAQERTRTRMPTQRTYAERIKRLSGARTRARSRLLRLGKARQASSALLESPQSA